MNEIRCVPEHDHDFAGQVFLDGARLDPGPSQRLWNHSPDGFAWGYGGSGPAQLALALLLAVTGDDAVSVSLHQQFKFEHVAGWPQAAHVAHVDIAAWIAAKRVTVEAS